MQDRPTARATYEDLRAVPPHLVAEILGGALTTHPRPGPRHVLAGSGLGVVLGGPFQLGAGGPGGWWILDEPELHLGEDVLVPDLAGWRRERLPRLPDTAWFEVAPDWVCEVISPATARHDRGLKRDIYGREGVRHLWHVDPAARLLEVFTIADPGWHLVRTFREDEEVAAPPFEAAPFRLGLLWAE
ncbi:MAG: Uma2 family endonuclease [Hyphomicrobiaceae bacterium]